MDGRRRTKHRANPVSLGRVVFALLLLITQVAWAGGACVCPTAPRPAASNDQLCPVNRSKSCSCCTEESGKKSGKPGPSEITTCVSATPPVAQVQADILFPVQALVATLPPALAALDIPLPPSRSVDPGPDPGLTRPPDLEGHSLRAPPAR
ncbi:MAG: hypothetical protein KF857_07090 [Fimbriimonadaceae bacterium]|nr:hypothetical protein [Fimbriimonadaceae bacterium]